MTNSGPLDRSEIAQIATRMKTAPLEHVMVMIRLLVDIAALRSETTNAAIVDILAEDVATVDWDEHRQRAEEALLAAEKITPDMDRAIQIIGYTESKDDDGDPTIAFLCDTNDHLMRFLERERNHEGPVVVGVHWSERHEYLGFALQPERPDGIMLLFKRSDEIAGLLVSMLEDSRIVLMPQPGDEIYAAVFAGSGMDGIIAEVQAWAAA